MTQPRIPARVKVFSGPESRAWELGDEAQRRMADGQSIIHLGVGDPDIPTPGPIGNAVVESLNRQRTHYSPLAGEPALRVAIAEAVEEDCGANIRPENVCVTTGAQGGLFAVLQCIASEGDEVVIVEPYYTTYPAVIGASGARIVRVRADHNRGYRINVESIEAAITERTSAILINSPSNPSGMIADPEEIIMLAQMAARRGLWLISDEVYRTCPSSDNLRRLGA